MREHALAAARDGGERGNVGSQALWFLVSGAVEARVVVDVDAAGGAAGRSKGAVRPEARAERVLKDDADAKSGGLTDGGRDEAKQLLPAADDVGRAVDVAGGDRVEGARHGEPENPHELRPHPPKDGALDAWRGKVVGVALLDVDRRCEPEASVGASGRQAAAPAEEFKDSGATRSGALEAHWDLLPFGQKMVDAIPEETLSSTDLTSVGQPRVGVCRVAVRFDVATPPVDPTGDLPSCGAAADGVEVVVLGAAALTSKDLGRVVADRENAVAATVGGVARGGNERVEAGPRLERVDRGGVFPSADHDASPAIGGHELVG